MNADIKVFPAKELSALDFAEIMDAALIGDGILQGCEITLTNGQLNIASGRMHIKGRLAEVSAGTIELPSGTSTALRCRLLAVCNLSLADPFYISLFDDAEYASIQSITSSDATFNVSNGVKYVVLGTAVVNCVDGVVTSWTPHETGSLPRLNKNYTDNLQQSIASLETKVDTNKTATDQQITQVSSTLSGKIARVNQWDESALQTELKKIPGVQIAARSSIRISDLNAWGYTVKQVSESAVVMENRGESDIAAANRRHIPKGIVGITLANAAFKVNGQAIGKNVGNVVVQGYGFGSDNWNLTLYNLGSDVAKIDATVKILYAINPDGQTA